LEGWVPQPNQGAEKSPGWPGLSQWRELGDLGAAIDDNTLLAVGAGNGAKVSGFRYVEQTSR
jgi:hypothetical protein